MIELKTDAGKLNPDAVVTTNFMQALLSMEQFRLIVGTDGDTHIRSFQQEMNRDYEQYVGIIPCDGLYDRNTNKASILVLQALEGMPVNVANGNFGPGARSHCPTIPYSQGEQDYNGSVYTGTKITQFTSLLNFCLYVNGYGSGDFGAGFSTSTVKSFQRLCALPQTGVANLATWMSTLVSTGDPDRKGTACDTRFEITATHLATLIANGYRYVGRYLTGGDFKQLRIGELTRIIDGDINVIVLFEEGYTLSYFTAAQGTKDAAAARAAAEYFQIPNNSFIFFAVDFDALDAEVTSNILPYFESVKKASNGFFRVGVYGARNICSRVMKAGYRQAASFLTCPLVLVGIWDIRFHQTGPSIKSQIKR